MELQEYIKQNTTTNTQEMLECITSMICDQTQPIPLSEESLQNALALEGEFFVLKLQYSDLTQEIERQKLKYKISQALSIIVSYEDDGSHFEEIHKFVEYMHTMSDAKQNMIFGIKNVEKLSQYPVKILFSGILPINQLKMSVGKEIDALIHSDESYFTPRFQQLRDELSKEIGIPILPLFPILDETLKPYEVRLVDLLDGRVISEFETTPDFNKESIEVYLLKLFYIYKVLAQK